MKVYFDAKQLPEFQPLSIHERHQALWQIGLKPYRHWQLWLGILVTSFVVLTGMDAFFLFSNESFADLAIGMVVMVAAFGLSLLLAPNIYFHYLRGYVGQAKFSPAAIGWKSSVKGVLPDVMLVLLVLTGALGIDLVINSVDENLDHRVVSIKAWPQPIPDEQNGYFAMVGMNVSAGASPYAAGREWIAAVNEQNHKQALRKEYPKSPDGLKYVAFDDHAGIGQNKIFCAPGKESCWTKLAQSHGEVTAWLSANKELLVRYKALNTYPRWQDAIRYQSDETPRISAYTSLYFGQSLLQASAMLAIEKGQVVQGIRMIEDDVQFFRNLLAGENRIDGKLVGSALLMNDLAWLLETSQTHPTELKPYWSQLAKLVEPLSPRQLTMSDAFRFEAQFYSLLDNIYLRKSIQDDEFPPILKRWVRLHEKDNAYANLVVNRWGKIISLSDVTNASLTVPLRTEDFDNILNEKTGMWADWYYNQIGSYWSDNLQNISYHNHVNRLFDLNALNTLVRLRITMLEQGVKAVDVPVFLSRSDPSQFNPETGKPFEWDEQRKQIYFFPAESRLREKLPIGGVPMRVGVTVM